MWKKPEPPERSESTETITTPSVGIRQQPVGVPSKAIIGPSISVKGEITGAEDLLVEGFVEGTVNLKQNEVTVGKSGRVNANVYGRVIHVEGEVTGDCYGAEQVIVHKSGHVKGNIAAPRVTLEDGARLKGAIDTSSSMGETSTVSTKEITRSTTPAKGEEARVAGGSSKRDSSHAAPTSL